jgi:uncharacterized protein (DUF433 family)
MINVNQSEIDNMDYRKRITSNSGVMLGKPIIKGTRITVEHILNCLADGMSIEEILEEYPHIERDDVLSAIAYSADVISKEEIIELNDIS